MFQPKTNSPGQLWRYHLARPWGSIASRLKFSNVVEVSCLSLSKNCCTGDGRRDRSHKRWEPILFNILFSVLLKHALGSADEGILLRTRSDGKLLNPACLWAKTKVCEVLLCNFLSAKDTALVARSEEWGGAPKPLPSVFWCMKWLQHQYQPKEYESDRPRVWYYARSNH